MDVPRLEDGNLAEGKSGTNPELRLSTLNLHPKEGERGTTSISTSLHPLSQVWRQAESPAFVEILQEIRLGECSAKSISFLQALKQPLGERATGIEATGVSGVVPTFLHSHRFNVEKKNLEEFAKIKEVPVTFISEDGGTTSQVIMDNWLKALQVCGFSQGMWE